MQSNNITWNSQIRSNDLEKKEESTMAKQVKKVAESVKHFFTIERSNRIYNVLD